MTSKINARSFCLALAVAVFGIACAGQHQKTREQIQGLQTAAFADALRGQPGAARKRLLEAERLGNVVGLGPDPVMIRTQMALGALYAHNFRDEKRAVAYMSEALARNPQAKLPSGMGTPRARKALALARRQASGSDEPLSNAEALAAEGNNESDEVEAAAPPAAAPAMAAAPTTEERPRDARDEGPRIVSVTPPQQQPAAASAPPAAAPKSRKSELDELLKSVGVGKPDAPAPGEAAKTTAAVAIASDTPAAVKPGDPSAPPKSGFPGATLLGATKAVEASATTTKTPEPPAVLLDPTATRVEGLMDCPVPMEAPPDLELVLRCTMRPDRPAAAVVLSYRPTGSEAFTEASMSRVSSGTFEGIIPATATTGKSLHFFVEAHGPVRASSGSPESPNLVMVREGAAPVGVNLNSDESGGGEAAGLTASGSDENPLDRARAQRALDRLGRRPQGKFWLSLGLGTGYGWQPGGRLEFRRDREIGPGGLPAGLMHLMPEVGYQVLDRVSVSLQARLQYAPIDVGGPDPVRGNPASRASAVLVRAAYTVGDGPWQGLGSVCAGGGDGFRLRVPRNRGLDLARSDTVKGGPLIAGAGVGAVYNINSKLSWPTEARVLLGFPTSAMVMELGTSLAYTF